MERQTDCGCSRRTFLAAAAAFGARVELPVFAGPFGPQDPQHPIPADKKLDPAWVRSLTERGEPAVWRGDALRHVGMPVGGITAGAVYLGGDGRLWLWDVFNRTGEGVIGNRAELDGRALRPRDGANYVAPPVPSSPIAQGFAIRAAGDRLRTLDADGFADVECAARYPIGTVHYRDPDCPVTVSLDAFSPFVPLDVDASSLPVTVMEFTIANRTAGDVEVEIHGWLENGVARQDPMPATGTSRTQVVRSERATTAVCSAAPAAAPPSGRADVVIADFEATDWGDWEVTGTAFAGGPVRMADLPAYQGDVGGRGERVVNSHDVRHGEDVRGGDAHTGTLTSPPFRLARHFVNFLIGGGAHPGATCVQLVVDGEVVREATGRNSNRMLPCAFDVRDLEGRDARLRIVDDWTGAWGNIGVDHIVLSDLPAEAVPLSERRDFGTMALALLEPTAGDAATARSGPPDDRFTQPQDGAQMALPGGDTVAVGRRITIAPGAHAAVRFVIAWHFPNLVLPGVGAVGRHYATRFAEAQAVVEHVAARCGELAATTRLWRDTWYDSTLPHWFLDRTIANASTLATSTCHRFADGRFYGWEGVGCCAGTCTHVWHYAQSVARLFPELERRLREDWDYGVAFDRASGRIDFRGGLAGRDAADGQAAVILRTWREHLTSPDDAFLHRVWPRTRGALEFLIRQDAGGGTADGMLEGEQHNTLDAEWFGRIPAIASLYLGALAAGARMAERIGDREFATRCGSLLAAGRRAMEALFDPERGFFVQVEDPDHTDAIGVGKGCYIDQVIGQGWAHQVGLGRLWDAELTRRALRALWIHNFAPDVGPVRASRPEHVRGRPYALAGDAGLLMCTWPLGGRRADWERHWQFGYFNECMSGFEHQVAGHMIAEGLLTEGLAIERAIHDRYRPELRNPFNEIECSDHYARAMASHGVFLAACGFEYDGPAGRIGFAPRLSPERFRAAFTAAEGWGSFAQRREPGLQTAAIDVRHGRLRLCAVSLEVPGPVRRVAVRQSDAELPAAVDQDGPRATVSLARDVAIEPGRPLEIELVL
ncbi:MAG: hypothetical protein IPM29_28555 [Planctomycetes bacterium]|nr:hypothetical protein [Planctomycetota bacterium]